MSSREESLLLWKDDRFIGLNQNKSMAALTGGVES